MDTRPLSFFFRSLAGLFAFSAILQLVFWIGDKLTGMAFRGGILLVSSILWARHFLDALRVAKKQEPALPIDAMGMRRENVARPMNTPLQEKPNRPYDTSLNGRFGSVQRFDEEARAQLESQDEMVV